MCWSIRLSGRWWPHALITHCTLPPPPPPPHPSLLSPRWEFEFLSPRRMWLSKLFAFELNWIWIQFQIILFDHYCRIIGRLSRREVEIAYRSTSAILQFQHPIEHLKSSIPSNCDYLRIAIEISFLLLPAATVSISMGRELRAIVVERMANIKGQESLCWILWSKIFQLP